MGFISQLTTYTLLLCILITLGDQDLNCRDGQKWQRARSYTHYVGQGSNNAIDASGQQVQTLESFLERKSTYVSVGVDRYIFTKFPGLPICVPEINRKFKTVVNFRVSDVVPDFEGSGFTKINIMIRELNHSTEPLLNVNFSCELSESNVCFNSIQLSTSAITLKATWQVGLLPTTNDCHSGKFTRHHCQIKIVLT